MKRAAINTIKDSAFYRASSLLDARDRKKIYLIIGAQILMGLLDLMGVVAIGALGALSVQGLESRHAGNKVTVVLRILHINSYSFQTQVSILGLGAAFVLILKTLLSIIFTRRIFFFLSRRGARLSADLISRVLAQNLLQLQARTSQETLFMVTEGVNNIMLGVLATSIQIVSDFSLLLIMAVGLLVVDPITALATIFLFAFIGFVLHRLLRVRARELGKSTYSLAVKNNEKILEVLNSYRETVVRNRRGFYAVEIGKLRYKMANTTAEFTFMPYIGKYVIESTVVIGSVLLSGYEFSINNAVHAISTVTVFLAASSRIAPAALRIQQGVLNVRNSFGSANHTINLIDELNDTEVLLKDSEYPIFNYHGFIPELDVHNVSFKYPGSAIFAIQNVTVNVREGTSTAIVGPSGAGKSTLIDLILGVLEPDSGRVEISQMSPHDASQKWPGAMSYVPQNIVISSGTVRDNVRMGYPVELASDEQVKEALRKAQLITAVDLMENKLDANVGEFGSKISGGQRQRLGIARSLFTNPKFLVLDEATSSLDGQTEAEVSSAITELKGSVTVIIVAHRLSTIRNVDQIVYMDSGKVVSAGTFEKVRAEVPDFDKQASLMGL